MRSLLKLLSNMAHPRDEKGFTLLELLVVVVVMIALSAIAVPVFAGQKNAAHDASAIVQIREMVNLMSRGYSDTSLEGPLDGSQGTMTTSVERMQLNSRMKVHGTAPSTTQPVFCISMVSESSKVFAYTTFVGGIYEAVLNENAECSGTDPSSMPLVFEMVDESGDPNGNQDQVNPDDNGLGEEVAPPENPEGYGIVLDKTGLVGEGEDQAVEVTWTDTEAGTSLSGEYNVYVAEEAPASEVVLGTPPSDPSWELVATTTETSFQYEAENTTPVDNATEGEWVNIQVVAVDEQGREGTTSNQVTIVDGFQPPEVDWTACAVTKTGKVRVVIQIPDTWKGLKVPYDWRLEDEFGQTLDTGRASRPGMVTTDIGDGVMLGNVFLMPTDSPAIQFKAGGTERAHYGRLFSSVDSKGKPDKRC